MDEFLLRALIGACLLAAMLGPLGSFVVWRRMAYFGDTIAHASLLGVALSLMLSLPMGLSIFVVAIAVALLLTHLVRDGRFATDTMLGILAHGALALGLVLVALNRSVRVDINAYLFGDVLAMHWADVGVLAVLALIIGALLTRLWRPLLITTLDPAIAQVEGISPARMQLALTLMLAAVIAVAIKLTGVLLITALLVIPAATARNFAKSPAQMAVLASVMGMVAVSAGLFAALRLDAPAAPMMVVVASALFLVSLLRR